jgi:hypothetical protein
MIDPCPPPRVPTVAYPAFDAWLTGPGWGPIADRVITFTSEIGWLCTAYTDMFGHARCPIHTWAARPGIVTANFAGDIDYLPSSGTFPAKV